MSVTDQSGHGRIDFAVTHNRSPGGEIPGIFVARGSRPDGHSPRVVELRKTVAHRACDRAQHVAHAPHGERPHCCMRSRSGGLRLMDILSLDATDQLQALAALRISARELLEASVVQMDRLNPKLNAVVSRDLDRAYANARMIDERRARGETLGLLGGLPMTVKDTFDVEGLPASAGIKALLDRTAEDAAVVARVRSADAIVWGKTNTPVYAADWQTYNSLYGTTSNPC